MRISAQGKRFFSLLAAGLYLFAALFSQQLHRHGDSLSGNSDFKKGEFCYSEKANFIVEAHCLSCHFLHTAKTVVPDHFAFHFFVQQQCSNEFSFVVEQTYFYHKSSHYLRGPPVFI